MQAEIQKVLELQSQFSSENTPAMAERGKLIRNGMTDWLRDRATLLSAGMSVPVEDFLAEGRDGTGRKSMVPWVRYGSDSRSPGATDGFYVVYLFARDGSAVWLSLMQGTTDFVGGEYRRKPDEVLKSRVMWARSLLSSWLASRADIAPLTLGVATSDVAHGYEIGDIASIRYEKGSIPSEAQLEADALAFAKALGVLYKAHALAPLPHESPEVEEAMAAAVIAAGKHSKKSGGAGFRQNAEERRLIEDRAVQIAKAYYVKQGWTVALRGAPYDLDLEKDGEKLTVEVKGTTSMGEAVVLTDGEVNHHAKAYPKNALVVVRDIVLDRRGKVPVARGGKLYELRPWLIDANALTAISHRYRVSDDVYAITAVSADELL